MISIMVVDDQTLLREGLQTIINLEDDMRTVALAANGREAIELALQTKPDLVLMDIKMPVLDGIEGMKRIKRELPGTIVLMLTTFLDEALVVDAMASGADGFLLKDMAGERIVGTIREAVKGHLMLPAPIAAKLAARLARLGGGTSADPFSEQKLAERKLTFTDRERKIIVLMASEQSNKQIAATLFMSEGTVRNYVSLIYNKIGTNDRAEAVARLRELMHEA